MDNQRLIQLADKADKLGLHKLADSIDNKIQSKSVSLQCEKSVIDGREQEFASVNINVQDGDKTTSQQNTFDSFDKAIEFFSKPFEELVAIADTLDKKGLTVLADKLDRIIEIEALEQASAIDTVLSIYRKKHSFASHRGFCKNAGVRKNNLPEDQRCPFGLSIPVACNNVGNAIKEMEANPENAKENRTRYNEFREGKPCPYAVEILEGQQGVNCSHGTPMQGRMPVELFHGSPIYPKLFEGFNTVNLDRNYFQYHDFGYTGEF